MNGIIHPCTRPPGKPEPQTDVEMFNNIFEYLDKIMRIIKPQKVIYMAIDGVAPRAKMNQQRSRRFRGAFEVEEQLAREQEIYNKWSKEIKFTDAPLKKAENSNISILQLRFIEFDKNVITPGTEFMFRLTKALQYYVQ
jgi:5'-3' exonuclease